MNIDENNPEKKGGIFTIEPNYNEINYKVNINSKEYELSLLVIGDTTFNNNYNTDIANIDNNNIIDSVKNSNYGKFINIDKNDKNDKKEQNTITIKENNKEKKVYNINRYPVILYSIDNNNSPPQIIVEAEVELKPYSGGANNNTTNTNGNTDNNNASNTSDNTSDNTNTTNTSDNNVPIVSTVQHNNKSSETLSIPASSSEFHGSASSVTTPLLQNINSEIQNVDDNNNNTSNNIFDKYRKLLNEIINNTTYKPEDKYNSFVRIFNDFKEEYTKEDKIDDESKDESKIDFFYALLELPFFYDNKYATPELIKLKTNFYLLIKKFIIENTKIKKNIIDSIIKKIDKTANNKNISIKKIDEIINTEFSKINLLNLLNNKELNVYFYSKIIDTLLFSKYSNIIIEDEIKKIIKDVLKKNMNTEILNDKEKNILIEIIDNPKNLIYNEQNITIEQMKKKDNTTPTITTNTGNDKKNKETIINNANLLKSLIKGGNKLAKIKTSKKNRKKTEKKHNKKNETFKNYP